MKIALASPTFPKSIADGLQQAGRLIAQAAAQQASIVCFPETFIPGYPWPEYEVEERSAAKMESALAEVCHMAAQHHIAVIMPMDWYVGDSLLNVAFVVSAGGEVLGYQSKNQLDPSEDAIWVPGTERHLFEIDGLNFGISICHEGFRYPESVRWAAARGAHIVFHPNFTGSDVEGPVLTEWGAKNNPYYEKAAMLRAMENTIYFASVNYAFEYPESATALIGPDGACIAHQPYTQPGVLVADIDIDKATGLLAKRINTGQYA